MNEPCRRRAVYAQQKEASAPPKPEAFPIPEVKPETKRGNKSDNAKSKHRR
jgi:hypothetical protein